jgi:hypothetical protein
MIGRSHPVRAAVIAAALGAAELLTALGVSPARAQQARASNALPGAAQEIVFTPAQCQRIVITVTGTVARARMSELSREFRQSWVNFIMPGGQRTCTGPRVIGWRTNEDKATYQTIVGRLEASDDHIYLERAGVSLAPAPVASINLN